MDELVFLIEESPEGGYEAHGFGMTSRRGDVPL